MGICSLICAYNEEKTIGDIVAESRKYSDRVLVVNDGSTDKTAEIADKAGARVLLNIVNKGKGFALKKGFEYFINHPSDILVTLDADGQHLPSEIPRLAEVVKLGFDMAIGYRDFNTEGVPFVRSKTNRFDAWFISKLLGKNVYDAQSGFRAFNRETAEMTYKMMNGNRFSCEPELVIKMIKKGVNIGWAPITTIYEKGRKSNIQPFKHFADSVRLYGKCLRR